MYFTNSHHIIAIRKHKTEKGVLFMQRMMQAVAPNMNDSQRKGLIVISPILIGSVAYGLSATFMIATNLLQIMF